MRVCPDAVMDDGLLDVMVLGPISQARVPAGSSRKVYKGTHVSHPAVTVHARRAGPLAAAGVVAYADGERLGAAAGHARGRAGRALPRPRTCARRFEG